jgi:hypothetical protein
MKRQIFTLLAVTAMLACIPRLADAANGHGHGHGVSHGHHGHGHGLGLGFGVGGYSDIYGFAELYRELYNNLPYFALHPPVYYSCPVPRTYGYSPFAYPPYVMTPDVVFEAQPVTIINPHVEQNKLQQAAPKNDRTAARSTPVEPLVILNPYVNQDMVARSH